MCELCDKNNTEENLRGSEGIVYDPVRKIHYLFVEYFRGEKIRLEVKFCSHCGNGFT
ncbi:hypothetical protein [Psychrobacillus phage Perkons]|nr:hypothetical protein [Psychrobacillus phage Perkons]